MGTYVAQLLPDRETAQMLVKALGEFTDLRGDSLDDPEVLAAYEVRLVLLKGLRTEAKTRGR